MASLSSSPAELVARVSQLTPAVTADHLRELLGDHVKIRELRMPEPVLWMSCPTGRAEVIGETEDDTKSVAVVLNGAQLDGLRIRVSLHRVDPSLPPVTPAAPARPKESTDRRRDSRDTHRRRRRSSSRSRSRSYERDRRRHSRHRHHSHRHGRHRSRSSSWSSDSSSSRSRSPVSRPRKHARTSSTRGARPLPRADPPRRHSPVPRRASRSPSPVWQ